MNRADRLLAVLKDGRPHSRREIQERAGFFLTNNAASELRKQGHKIEQHREGDLYLYTLTSPLREGDPPTSARRRVEGSPSLSGASLRDVHGERDGQAPLFDIPPVPERREPAWH